MLQDHLHARFKNPETADLSHRVRILTLLFLGLAVVLIGRLFTWQVVRADSLGVIAKSQHQTSSTLEAHRGSILSSDSFPLVSTSEGYLLWASIKDLKDKSNVARTLAPLLVSEETVEDASNSAKIRDQMAKDEEERLKKLFDRNDVVWVPIKKKISRDLKQRIEALDLAGIGFDQEEDRGYPESSMAANILGFVGKDSAGSDKGYFGLEGFYDLTLSGRQGSREWEKDAQGLPILMGTSNEVVAHDGLSLKTTINRAIQYVVEKHLSEGVNYYQADGGTVVVLNPQDGSVLASASFPSYSPARYGDYDKSRYQDPAIGQTFEPGSIFKVIVMASALDAGVITPDTKCGACDKPITIDDYKIESGTGQSYPDETMPEIILHSDNVGMIWVSEQLGRDKLYDYLTKFGIGQPTGIDLQGEESPQLRKKGTWGRVDQFTASFGQGLVVTPIQMVRAVSAIANGGLLPKPHIVSDIISDGRNIPVNVENSERIISEKAARDMTAMMVNNVNTKADMWHPPHGFELAGKTGTAQVAISGHYDEAKTVASFLGFGPTPNPKFAMIVTLKNPKVGSFASVNAAPLWFDIARDILPLTGARPN